MFFFKSRFFFSACIKIGSPLLRFWNLRTVHMEDHSSCYLTCHHLFRILLAVNKLLIPGEKKSNATGQGVWRAGGQRLSSQQTSCPAPSYPLWHHPLGLVSERPFAHPHHILSTPCSDANRTGEVTALLRSKADSTKYPSFPSEMLFYTWLAELR